MRTGRRMWPRWFSPTSPARRRHSAVARFFLLSWLYTSTHYAAANTVRTERRRQAREQEAHTMHELLHPAPAADWNQLRPVLDEAVHDLTEQDRTAILLRFFEGRPFAEVGETLGLNEDAARKRVERAVDQLHGGLTRRGITSTTAALAVALAQQPAVAAPAGLAAVTTAGALAAGSHGLSLFHLMSMTKLQIGIIGAVLVAGTAGLVLQQQDNARLRADNATLLQGSEELSRLREENMRLAKTGAEVAALRAEHAELVQLRNDVAALKSQAQAASRAPATVSVGLPTAEKAPTVTGLVAIADMQNMGRATARAAGQTVAWAVHHGEIDTAASLLAFDPESRAKLEELITTLPDNLRAEYGTPERLMAFVMSGTPRPIAAVQVIDETQQGPDDYVQHVQLQYEDGRINVAPLRFHRTADGWQQIVAATTVDRVVTYLKSGSVPPPVVKK
jgi:RNA polymerase sigma factor (sigma-70 family)